MPTIRPATPEDSLNVAALLLQVWLHTYATRGIRSVISNYVLTEFAPQEVARILASPGHLCLLAEVEAHLVGLALIEWNSSCPATQRTLPALQKLYVQEHFTGRRIGTALLDAALECCRERGAPGIWLVAQAQNARALRFYRRNRFTQVGNTDFVLGEERYENCVLHRTLN